MEYTQEIGTLCGFDVTAEKMKIPSTKRICLVGQRRLNRNLTEINENVGRILGNILGEFKPRSAIEPVRNCSQISKNVQKEILILVQGKLLSVRNEILLESGRKWNQGGTFNIPELASVLSGDLLMKLKSECKGLQTLLKNHHQVFFVNSGTVQLRTPESLAVNSLNVKNRDDFKWKQKPCWFFGNHPDGCPIPETNCSYSH